MKKKLQFKNLALTSSESQQIKGGNIDFGNNGTGSTGFINWDDVDPRDNGFVYIHKYASLQVLFKKKV